VRGPRFPVLRPAELAGDCAPVLDAVVHLLATLRQAEQYEPDYLLLLQPTSPLRTSSDIEGAFAQMQVMQADAVVSVCAASSHPFLCRSLDERGRLRPFIEHPLNQARRQELPPAYVVNGALYLIKTSVLLETGSWMPASCCGYVMPDDCSVDIDTLSDLVRAEWLLMRRERGHSNE
jgi:CMP-N,N'-diacetyllegionaminic acid synthase